MIYTAKTKQAMKLCYEAHQGQVGKSGIPYVFHPIHVAEQMSDEATTIVLIFKSMRRELAVEPAKQMLTGEQDAPTHAEAGDRAPRRRAVQRRARDGQHGEDVCGAADIRQGFQLFVCMDGV